MTTIRKNRRSRRIAIAIAASFVAVPIATAASAISESTQVLSDCPSGYMCVWSGSNYSGTMWKTNTTSTYKAIGPSSIDSYYNNRSKRSYLHELANGSGVYTCLSAGAKSSNLSGWTTTAEAVYLSTSTLC
jgi:hypothetical protein